MACTHCFHDNFRVFWAFFKQKLEGLHSFIPTCIAKMLDNLLAKFIIKCHFPGAHSWVFWNVRGLLGETTYTYATYEFEQCIPHETTIMFFCGWWSSVHFDDSIKRFTDVLMWIRVLSKFLCPGFPGLSMFSARLSDWGWESPPCENYDRH